MTLETRTALTVDLPGLRACVYGQAVGDALGVPYEFKPRGTFRCTDMVGHGTHHKPAGTWSDDTAMALALCDSLRACGRVNIRDVRERFTRWMDQGDYTVDGLFDIGNTTAVALRRGRGRRGERDNGNGSLMRTIPLAFFAVTDDEVRAISAITHAHPLSTEACVDAVRIARLLADCASVREAVQVVRPQLLETLDGPAPQSSGFVLHTLAASLWCLSRSHSYRDCVLEAVNLGDDTDTTAAVAGAFAGIVYGIDGIPAPWLAALRGKEVIEACLPTG